MIIITGQTGTGKTSLALKLAAEHNGELLSADSRQIYREMDIGTGKVDNPRDLILDGSVWKLKGVPIYGINLINPFEIFSAGDFAQYGKKVIEDMINRGKTPIIVGGTGFYIKSLINPDDTVFIPQNRELRDTLESQPVQNLKQLLQEKDQEKFHNMNNSDQNNPRRLVRALEVAQWKKQNNRTIAHNESTFPPAQWIGLTASKTILEERITQRINVMMENGFEEEVVQLVDNYGWDASGMQTIGYKEWKPFFDGKLSFEELTQSIILAHIQYARKQMIYFKRFSHIKWQDISQP